MGLSRTITILLCWRSINPKRHKAWRHDKTYSVEIHGSTNEGSRKHNLDLPNQFSLAIDDSSKGSTHFVGLFAAYTEPNEKGYSSVLLSFSTMFDEKNFTAQDHYEHLTYVLSVYKKTFENVVAITGDNVATNKRIGDRCGVKFVGCASQRLNLAVSAYLERMVLMVLSWKKWTLLWENWRARSWQVHFANIQAWNPFIETKLAGWAPWAWLRGIFDWSHSWSF